MGILDTMIGLYLFTALIQFLSYMAAARREEHPIWMLPILAILSLLWLPVIIVLIYRDRI